jgi:O-antigen/teichoic acid export membrane protein
LTKPIGGPGRLLARAARSRLGRNIGALATGQATQLIIQLISVPAFLAVWSVEKYGVWLVLFSVPAFLVMADLGFTTAAANEMAMASARGDRARAAVVYTALRRLVLGLGAALLSAAAAVVFAMGDLLDFAQPFAAGRADVTLILLIGYGLLSLYNGLLLAGYRAGERFAEGALWITTILLVETLAAISVALAGGGMVAVAATFLAARGAGTIGAGVVLRRTAAWLFDSRVSAPHGTLRVLLRPALASAALPIAQALSLQGVVAVVAAAAGPAAVPVLTTVRTLVRSALQAVLVISNAIMPEFSVAEATARRERKERLTALSLATSFVLLIPAAVVLVLVGPRFVQLWTGGDIVPEPRFIAAMAADMVLYGTWLPLSNLLLAINRHESFSWLYLAATTAAVAAAYPVVERFGLIGAPAVLGAVNLLMLAWVTMQARRHGLLNRQAILRPLRGLRRR